jgi:NAD(P)-dependent dehydrogenase (short-subunit alcohol dehydrogenase family)
MSDILSKFRLDGKVALVTGGGKGIGKGICLAYAEAGADVALAEIDKNAGKAVASQVEAMGRKALFLQTDVTKEEQIIKMATDAKKAFGRIDILVNNVGGPIFGPRPAPGSTPPAGPMPNSTVLNMTTDIWNAHLIWNLTDTFWCCREVGKIMAAQNSGVIINIASVAGNRAVPGMAAYGAPKAAVIHLTEILSLELRRYHIRVNCITPMNILHSDQAWGGPSPLSDEERAKKSGISVGRSGTLDDTSALALFLGSEASSYITGLTIDVAGGPLFPADVMERFESQPPVV